MKLLYAISFMVFVTILTSCYKDDLNEFQNLGNPEVQQEWAVPLIYNDLNMNYWVIGAPQLTLEDTASIELPIVDSDTTKYIQNATFKGYTENTFPLDGSFQIYFLNEQDVITDSLFSQPEIILQASASGNPGISEPVVIIDQTRYNVLSQNKKMIFKLVLNTANSPLANVVYAPFRFTFKVGVKMKIVIQL